MLLAAFLFTTPVIGHTLESPDIDIGYEIPNSDQEISLFAEESATTLFACETNYTIFESVYTEAGYKYFGEELWVSTILYQALYSDTGPVLDNKYKVDRSNYLINPEILPTALLYSTSGGLPFRC